jgi:TPR repeat protein
MNEGRKSRVEFQAVLQRGLELIGYLMFTFTSSVYCFSLSALGGGARTVVYKTVLPSCNLLPDAVLNKFLDMKSQPQTVFIKFFRGIASLVAVSGLTLCVPAQDTNFNFQVTQAAADKGDARAQYEMGHYYVKANGATRSDYAKAVKYIRQSAEQGCADAEVVLGSFYGHGWGVPRNVATAVQWYRKAADQGNALAQYAMGTFYATGRGVTNDMDEAIKWWQKAAAQNQVDAQNTLGQLYLISAAPYGTNYLNYAEAGRWLRQAAAQGSAQAMNNLGVAYENGLGVKRDFAEAAKWYRQAAELGDASGQANLGQLYFDGRGVTNDLVQAYKWFKLSASQGNVLGTAGFASYQNHSLLTPKQLADAEQSVLDFHPRPASNQP